MAQMELSELAKQRLEEAKQRTAARKRERREKAQAANVFTPGREVVWRPQPGPQTALVTCPYPEILYGGARGGGKTDGCLGAWLYHANKYGEYARGIFFRRRFKQLEHVQDRCSQLFTKLGALYNKGDATWVFPSGATLKLRHLWDESAEEEYRGHQYTFMVAEEITNWPTLAPIDKLRGTLRSAHGVPTKLILTANPGGAGHGAVRARYVDPAPTGYKPIVDPKTGETRVFIPAKLEDNQILMQNDPFYERRLMQSGSPSVVKAWRFGDWSVISGGFFDDLYNQDAHLIRPFDIPPTWRWRRSFDWGSAAPASLGVWAISDGNPVDDLDGFVFPRGSFIRVSEWYTCIRDANGNLKHNEGMRLTNIALGNGIGIRSQDHNFSGCVADPAIFSQLGRESIYDEIRKGAAEVGHHLVFQRADNNRIAGWQRLRDMLEASAAPRPEKPGIWAFETCEHFARTIPVLQRDEKNPDDIDTDQEDHVADETRYLVMTGARTLSIGTRLGE